MHQKDIQIGGMIGDNHIGPIGERCCVHSLHRVHAENAHQPTPKYKKSEAVLFPFWIEEYYKKERIKHKCKHTKYNADVAFPQKG